MQDRYDFHSVEALDYYELLIAFTIDYLTAFSHDSFTDRNHRIHHRDVFPEQIKIHIRHTVYV